MSHVLGIVVLLIFAGFIHIKRWILLGMDLLNTCIFQELFLFFLITFYNVYCGRCFRFVS